jgi:hypothetical protein
VLFGWRSFEIYPLQVRTAGATPVQVPLTDYTHDLDAMLAAITDRTRLIFVCNPNNPTSTVVKPDALARFVEAVPSNILIALDEAYVEYIRDGLVPDIFGLVLKQSNVVVLRTFSKAYGLASPNASASPPHCAMPGMPCHRRRPTSSGCRCPGVPRNSPTTRRTVASSSARTAMRGAGHRGRPARERRLPRLRPTLAQKAVLAPRVLVQSRH